MQHQFTSDSEKVEGTGDPKAILIIGPSEPSSCIHLLHNIRNAELVSQNRNGEFARNRIGRKGSP